MWSCISAFMFLSIKFFVKFFPLALGLLFVLILIFMLKTRILKSQFVFFTLHHFNIYSHTIEMFKVNKNIAVTIFDYILTRSYHSQNLCVKASFVVSIVHNGKKLWSPYGIQSITHYTSPGKKCIPNLDFINQI